MSPIEQSWERIDDWLTRAAPNGTMPGPASAMAVERLQERIGLRLPDEVRESLLCHDGSALIELVPPGYCLHGTEAIAQSYLNDTFPYKRDIHFVPIAHLGRTQMVVDMRTGQIGSHDVEWGYSLNDYEFEASLSILLDYIANVLESPNRVAIFGDEEWQASVNSEDFPGKFFWGDEW